MRSDAAAPFTVPRDPMAIYLRKLAAYEATMEAEERLKRGALDTRLREAEADHSVRMMTLAEQVEFMRLAELQEKSTELHKPAKKAHVSKKAPTKTEMTPEQLIHTLQGNVTTGYIMPLKRELRGIIRDERDGLFAEDGAEKLLDGKIDACWNRGLYDIANNAPASIPRPVVEQLMNWYTDRVAKAETVYRRSLFLTKMRGINPAVPRSYSEKNLADDYFTAQSLAISKDDTIKANLERIEANHGTYESVLPLVSSNTRKSIEREYNNAREYVLKDVKTLATMLPAIAMQKGREDDLVLMRCGSEELRQKFLDELAGKDTKPANYRPTQLSLGLKYAPKPVQLSLPLYASR